MSHRLACLYVPLFPLAARLRSEPDLEGEAVAVFEGNGHAARVVAASRSARQAGIKPGMSPPQTRALVPNLTVRARDPACESTAQHCLLEVAEGFSPRIEDAGEGVVYLELDGLERHFPGASPEADLGHALTVAAGKAGLPAWVGVASSKLAARVAAEQPDSPTIVPAGREAGFLAPLPLARLSSEAEVVETLRRWGIRSVGEFANLPKNQVVSRLGDAGRELHASARGLDPRPLVPHQPPPVFEEAMDLEWPLVALEPFLFVARAALDRLARRLAARGLACARLALSLRLEPDGHHQRTLQLPAPTREVKTLLTLVRLDLDATPPGAPVTGFTFSAQPDRPREAQLSLFGPAALAPDRLATTLARLFALLGPGRVGSPRTVDGHRPERSRLEEYAPPPPPAVRREPRGGRGLLGVRVLRPPVPIEVATAGLPEPAGGNGPRPRRGERGVAASDADPGAALLDSCAVATATPCEILPTVQEGSAKRPRLAGRIRVASGPWTLEEAWWSEEKVERDYWDVELADGGLYRIFRERVSGEWFADGVYD